MTETEFDEADIDEPTDEQTDDGSGELRFDTPDGSVASIATAGDPVRSWLSAIRILVDEAKLHIDDDGVRISAADPANVGIIETDWAAAGFASYRLDDDVDDLVVGMPLDRLASSLQYARKRSGNGDPVRIDVIQDGGKTRIQVAVIRADQQAKRVTEFFGIDPNSILAEPDIPDLSDMLPHRAQPGVEALTDALVEFDHDHAWLERDGATLVVGNQPTENPNLDAEDAVVDTFEFPNAAWAKDDVDAPEGGSIFSMNYLDDFVTGLKRSKADRMTMDFGQEYPVRIDWDATDWGISGTYLLAPRIQAVD